MGGGTADTRTSKEVEYWLGLSSIYFRTFLIKENPGPIWFLIAELLKHGNGNCTVRQLRSALKNAGVIRADAVYDVSQYCKYLQSSERGFVEIVPDQAAARSFRVGTIIKPTEKLEEKVSQYVKQVVRDLFDQKMAAAASRDTAAARGTFNCINAFMFTAYIPCWERLLRELADIASKSIRGDATTIFGNLRGNSEVFVLLHKLWEFHLEGADGHGFTIEELSSQHLRTASSEVMAECIEMLKNNGLIEGTSAKGDRYRLRWSHYMRAFDRYAAEFVTLRKDFSDCLASYFFTHELGSGTLT